MSATLTFRCLMPQTKSKITRWISPKWLFFSKYIESRKKRKLNRCGDRFLCKVSTDRIVQHSIDVRYMHICVCIILFVVLFVLLVFVGAYTVNVYCCCDFVCAECNFLLSLILIFWFGATATAASTFNVGIVYKYAHWKS